jgi:nitrogen regulatory protein P-II 1
MKKIEAIIKPYKLEELKTALSTLGVSGVTVTPETRGFGRQKGHVELYHGAEYETSFVPKVRIETVVADSRAEEVIELILERAKSGRIGDGKIFVTTVEDAVRIRTGEKGDRVI